MFKLLETTKKIGFGIKITSSDEENDYNMLYIHLIYPGFYIQIPNIIKPLYKKEFSEWNKSYYIRKIEREYGFIFSDDYLHLYYGIQPGEWYSYDKKNSDHTKLIEYFWTYGRCCRYSFYDVDGNLIDNQIIDNRYKYKTFIDKYDNEEITAKISIEEREWRRGRKWIRKILNLFCKPYIERYIDIKFDKEFGNKKGTWKGGILGMSFTMNKNETIDECWNRFLEKENS